MQQNALRVEQLMALLLSDDRRQRHRGSGDRGRQSSELVGQAAPLTNGTSGLHRSGEVVSSTTALVMTQRQNHAVAANGGTGAVNGAPTVVFGPSVAA